MQTLKIDHFAWDSVNIWTIYKTKRKNMKMIFNVDIFISYCKAHTLSHAQQKKEREREKSRILFSFLHHQRTSLGSHCLIHFSFHCTFFYCHRYCWCSACQKKHSERWRRRRRRRKKRFVLFFCCFAFRISCFVYRASPPCRRRRLQFSDPFSYSVFFFLSFSPFYCLVFGEFNFANVVRVRSLKRTTANSHRSNQTEFVWRKKEKQT